MKLNISGRLQKIIVLSKQKVLKFLLPDNNYLKLCKLLCVDFFELKIVKFWTVQLIIFYVSLFFIQTYLFLHRFDVHYLFKYGPSYFVSLNIIFCILVSPFSSKIVTSIDEELEMWKADNKIIKEESKRIIILIIMNVTLILISTTLFVLPQDSDEEVYYQLAFFEEFLPECKSWLSWFYRSQLWFVVFITVVSPSYHLVYGFNRIKFQLYMLLDYIRKLNDEETEKRLLFCLKRHIELSKSGRQALRRAEYLAFPFELIAVLVYISSAVFYFSFQDFLDTQYWRFVTLSASLILTFVIVFYTGQQIENISAEIFDTLIDTDWYKWDESVKKIYLMFLLNSSKPFQLKLSENFCLNYKLAVQTIKCVFSVTSVIYQLNFRKLQE